MELTLAPEAFLYVSKTVKAFSIEFLCKSVSDVSSAYCDILQCSFVSGNVVRLRLRYYAGVTSGS